MYKELMEYDEFIAICTTKSILNKVQYNFRQETENSDKYYEIFVTDGNLRYECHLNSIDTSTGLIDFETNYKDTSNQTIAPIEPETGIPKTKPRPVEGTLAMTFIYFTTGDTDSLDYGEDTGENVTITTSTGTTHLGTSTGVTEITITPSFSYYLDGGGIQLISSSAGEFPIEVYVIMAPNIPPAYGGNWTFVKHKRLWYQNQHYEIEAPPKYVKYYSENPYANQVRLRVLHDKDINAELEFYVRTFK